jgi:hypothetical protein
MISLLRSLKSYLELPAAAKAERRLDSRGLPAEDPGCERVIRAGVAWLGRAQDQSPSADGGVARDFSLVKGWATSYPETTGYIVPTMLDYARRFDDGDARERARRMLDWFVAIQMPGGGFQGGRIDSTPVVPVTFNTGQILLGLAAGAAQFGEAYFDAMCQAAQWLADSQDPDGCWRKHPTPFAKPGEKAYETHVAWGLLEAARVAPDKGFGEAGLKNVRWALTHQRDNGWFEKNCLNDPKHPLTHTIGYVLRGVVEAHRFAPDGGFLEAARKTADGVLGVIREDGYLPGRLNSDWTPAVDWVCLTGSVQIAHCWLMLYQFTGETRYRDAAYAANAYVRRTVKVDGPADTRGGVKGSFPVQGGYGEYEYLNWACKFCVDANLLEQDVRAADKA